MKICSVCQGSNIEISLPAWFNANTYEQTGIDEEADALYTWCEDCDESRRGDWTEEVDRPGRCPDCGTQTIEEAIGQTCTTCRRGVIEEDKPPPKPDPFEGWLDKWPGEEGRQ